jgi:hypothetical protein
MARLMMPPLALLALALLALALLSIVAAEVRIHTLILFLFVEAHSPMRARLARDVFGNNHCAPLLLLCCCAARVPRHAGGLLLSPRTHC